MDVRRTGIILKPNNSRVLCRPFELRDSQRALKIIAPRHGTAGRNGRGVAVAGAWPSFTAGTTGR